MTMGLMIMTLAFLTTIGAAFAFAMHASRGQAEMLVLGKRLFYVASIFVFMAISLLAMLLVTHQFDVTYVYSYTNRMLSSFYLIAALWAGQEGTFLLWLFIGSLYGLVLIRQNPKNLSTILATMLSVHIIIFLILFEKSPFAMIYQSFTDVAAGFVPQDGRGLNPLLINPWMVIHPPILFLGYVSAEVIFGFVVAALLNGNYRNWYKSSWPWVLFSSAILGTGLILGGYWAYATLGWGGFWGWDPVENASFVPWVILAVLIHGLIIQNKKNALLKTNLFLGGLVFLAVLYGTFLTRSGVLTDFSVHSFGKSDINYYLTFFLLFYVIVFLVIFFKNFGKIQGDKLGEEAINRESILIYGMLVLIASAILTFVGMSFPLISKLWGQPSNVPLAYYNIVHIPIGILIALLAGLAPFVTWKTRNFIKMPFLIAGLLVALLMSGILFFAGIKNLKALILIFSTLFLTVTNILILIEVIRKDSRKIGAYVTHVGLALMFFGIVFSSFYSESEKINLRQNERMSSRFGLQLEFLGELPQPDGRNKMKINVSGHGRDWQAKPRFFFSDYNQAYMASPDIEYHLAGDYYIAPIQFQPGGNASQQLVFKENDVKSVGAYTFTFKGFETNQHMEDGSGLQVWALFSVKYTENGYPKTFELKPSMRMTSNGLKPESVMIPNSDIHVHIAKINANDHTVMLDIQDPSATQAMPAILSVEISKKPFISLLWIGTLVLVIGMFVSLFNRLHQTAVIEE